MVPGNTITRRISNMLECSLRMTAALFQLVKWTYTYLETAGNTQSPFQQHRKGYIWRLRNSRSGSGTDIYIFQEVSVTDISYCTNILLPCIRSEVLCALCSSSWMKTLHLIIQRLQLSSCDSILNAWISLQGLRI